MATDVLRHLGAAGADREARIAELRRMRFIATSLLVLMTAIFLATTAARLDWAWLPYVRAFAEAGMVGACADWFAVVALFRHPLGIPIPHTAIVPNNKERIGPALDRFITNNFLATRVAHERLAQVDMVAWLARWLNDPESVARFARNISLALPRVLRAMPAAQGGEHLGKLARYGIESVPAAPLASRILAVVWAQGNAQALLDSALDFAEGALARHKDFITRKVSERSSRWIPQWVDTIIADRVMSGVLTTLNEMRTPEHPWRAELQRAVEKLIDDLATDADLYARGEAMKAELLASPLFHEQAKTLWTQIERGLLADPDGQAEAMARACEAGLRSLGLWLAHDPERRARLNRWIRLVILRTILPRRAEIGAYVAQVVHNWDSATLVDRLELQVGKDLQYIRINGTLVGGLVGLLIFIASRWIVAP
jgi:uncharacterized membrane-anchored protein YjiN (DUF445 family)